VIRLENFHAQKFPDKKISYKKNRASKILSAKIFRHKKISAQEIQNVKIRIPGSSLNQEHYPRFWIPKKSVAKKIGH